MKENRSKRNIIFGIVFGAYIATLLWLTIFSRIGSHTRAWFPPFHSISELINGNPDFFILGGANILLFVPLGFLCRYLTETKHRSIALIGFGTSLAIESCQWIFRLGEFECDDLINNTIGAVVGGLIFKILFKKLPARWFEIVSLKKNIITICLSMFLFESIPSLYMYSHYMIMKERASYFDLEDGRKNLLILNGKSGYVGDSNVYVDFLSDGRISIEGSSNIRAWIKIATISLKTGVYFVEGMNEIETNTFSLDIGYIDSYGKYQGIASNVGTEGKQELIIDNNVEASVYIGVYAGVSDCKIVSPVIYSY